MSYPSSKEITNRDGTVAVPHNFGKHMWVKLDKNGEIIDMYSHTLDRKIFLHMLKKTLNPFSTIKKYFEKRKSIKLEEKSMKKTKENLKLLVDVFGSMDYSKNRL